MNKKRMSDRKSELRLNIEDFCLGLPQNSDPVIGYLLTILEWEASLDVQTNSILHKAFVNQIQQLKCKLKMELKYIKDKAEGIQTHNNNITKLVNQFHKLKQLFSYCLILSKKKSELCKQLQKFNQYAPREPNLTQQLQNYLNQPIIFETIFHSYLRVYNVNVLTADLISFLYAQHQQKLILYSKQQFSLFKKWSNPDIQLLKNQTIIFKQLTDMNKKYILLTQKLKNSYIFQLCNDPSQILDSSQTVQQQIKGQQQTILKQKVKKLELILKKIKKQPGLYDDEKSVSVVMQIQPLCNLSVLDIAHDYSGWRVIEQNKQFFLETLYGKSWSENVLGDEQFSFMRQKIIKVETLFFLNRTLSAMNVISYIYNQLDLQIRQNYQYQFKNLRKLIGSEFISKDMYECKVSNRCHKSAFVLIDSNVKAYNVIDAQNNKILYPSTVNYFIGFIKNMLSTTFPDKEGLLQILQAKSKYMQRLAQTISNIYQIIKIKQLSCYKLLREYIEIILKSSCWNNLGNYDNFRQIIATVDKEKQKIGIISQIIYEFDHNYSIKQPLQELIRIQFEGLTKNCTSTFKLYKSILYEIIQIRNGLKLDHYYSVNQIHETFSLIPTDIEKLDEHKKGKHQDLYFQDIIHQICTASHNNLYLPKLFFFLDLQLKFKRIVFKLQLCWSCNRQSMFQRKAQAFKDFINNYCSPIFQIINSCHRIVEILQKIQQIERYIDIFAKEVSRFHLIQKLVSIVSYYKDRIHIQSAREHMNRLSLDKLEQINTQLSIFNPIQSQKESNRIRFLENMAKNIQTYSAIRLQQMKNFNSVEIKQKQKLASLVVLLHMIPARNQAKDHINLINLHKDKDGQIRYDLYQIKQNQAMQTQYQEWMNSDNMQSLIKFNEDVIVLSILKTLRQMEAEELVSSQDYKQLYKLMQKFQLSPIFTSLSNITDIQFWRSEFGIMTKYHQIYQLMFHFDSFNAKVFGNIIKKAQYKDKKMLNLLDHTVNFSYQRSDFITKLYYVFQITPLTRMKLQQNIQSFHKQILQTQSVYRKSTYYHNKLKKIIYTMFCEQIQKIIKKCNIYNEIQLKFNQSKQPIYYVDELRKKMLNSVSAQYTYDMKPEGFGHFKQIQMFKQKRGYELLIIEAKQNKQYKIGANKKYVQRSKKPIISPHKIEEQKTKPLEDLRRKYKVQMLKKSIHIRKQISKLQLSQNKIRDQIVWETSKLQHSVVDKINQFITLSNVDQQQSYINFKHTVNLQTIKGIENVIEQQTEMYMEKKNAPVQRQDGFITGVQENEQQKVDNKCSLLETNVASILQHMKKIKIFSAWKKTMKKTDLTKKQWCNFNLNVQNILNNDKIVQSLLQVEDARNNYLRQNVTCQIMKQENMRINQKIQQLKIDNLQRKVRSYRENLLKQ